MVVGGEKGDILQDKHRIEKIAKNKKWMGLDGERCAAMKEGGGSVFMNGRTLPNGRT